MYDGSQQWAFKNTGTRPVEIGRRRNEAATADNPRVDVNLNEVSGNSLVSRRQGNITWNPVKRAHVYTNFGRNGTTVGYEKLNGQTSTVLRDGQVLRMGKISLQYFIERCDGSYATFTPFRPIHD